MSLGGYQYAGAAADIISPEDALRSTVNNMLENPVQPSGKQPVLPDVAHTTDFTWGAAQDLRGIYSSAELYFNLPGYWNTGYACVRLEYRVSQLIRDVPCTLTFSINKQPFYSCRIEYRNDGLNSLYALIPGELLKDNGESGSNYLEISGYAKLFNEKCCTDQYSDAAWITFSEASGVEVGYDMKVYGNRLELYPYPFMSSINGSGSDTAIGVADVSQNEEVAAAMMVMSGLSSQTGENNNLTMGSWEEVRGGKYKNRIFVGLSKDMPSELQKYIVPYKTQLKGQALVLAAGDDRGGPLLIIASDDADCLAEAGFLLRDGRRIEQEKGSAAFVKKGTGEISVNAGKSGEMKADRYTFQEMTGGGFEFIGPHRQVKTLFLPVTADYALSSSAKVSIVFRYSKNLDFSRSMLTVYWGDIPVGSKKLLPENADRDELTFFMPADVAGTRSGSMKFAFDLEMQEPYCIREKEEMPWAYITKNSSLYLPQETNVRLSFDNRPAPFLKNGSINDVMLVLPDKPDSGDLTLMGKTLALYSKSAVTYGRLKVCKAGEFTDKDANYNIITAGTPGKNSFIWDLNDRLYFKYDSGRTAFVTNEKLILSSGFAKSIGTLQLLQSPYTDGRAVLVLTGPDGNSLKMAERLVSNEKTGWNLKNDFVLIDSEGKIKSYQFQNYEIKEKTPTLPESVTENKNSLLFALAGTSVMLVLFLAIILIFLRVRKSGGKH